MSAPKKPSEIRKYYKFVFKIRLVMFLVIPVTLGLYFLFGSNKNVFLGLIYAGFSYFISIMAGMFVLNRRYTDAQARRISRFEEKTFWRILKGIGKELLLLIGLVELGYLTTYYLKIDELSYSFIPVIVLGIMGIVFQPRIRDPDTDDDFDNESLEEEYVFSEHSSPTYYNFIMDPAHPSSILNPTNPVSPAYRAHDN